MGSLFRESSQKSVLRWGIAGVLMASAIAAQLSPSAAVQLGDGSTAFTNPPRLVSFITTDNYASRKDPTYYVTVNLLPDAGESLKTLEVALTEGRFTRLDYHTGDIEAFEGDRGDRQASYPIEFAEFDEESQTLTIQLAQAAPPGRVITFALKPVRNPTREGVYLFEVTAAPDGQNPVTQRIGTGRINIYDRFFNFL